MLRKGIAILSSVALLSAVVLAAVADAQQRGPGQGGQGRGPGGGGQGPGQRQRGGGPGGFGGGFGGGGGLAGLLRIEEVRKELEVTDDQAAEVEALAEGQRGGGRPDFGNFRELSDEERNAAFARLREEAEARTREMDAKIAEILLPPQYDRLKEIDLQVRGTAALSDKEVAATLKISESQQQELSEVREQTQAEQREQMRDLFQAEGADRESMGEKMAAMRREADEKVLAVLSAEQREHFAAMKGEPFEMPRGGFAFGGRGGRGGPGGPGGQGGPGGRRPGGGGPDGGGRPGGGRPGGGGRPDGGGRPGGNNNG